MSRKLLEHAKELRSKADKLSKRLDLIQDDTKHAEIQTELQQLQEKANTNKKDDCVKMKS